MHQNYLSDLQIVQHAKLHAFAVLVEAIYDSAGLVHLRLSDYVPIHTYEILTTPIHRIRRRRAHIVHYKLQTLLEIR